MIVDFAAEFADAAREARAQHYDHLVAQGVPRSFLYRGACRLGVAEIEPSADGFYQPLAGGELAYIMPALPLPAPWEPGFPDCDPGDLIAWLPRDPRRWWRRCGTVPLLNPVAIDAARYRALPLLCWSTPLQWLRLGGDGVVVLSPDVDLRLWFGDGLTIYADSIALGEELERRLRQPPARARILVPARAA